jgi:hypothetical protein
MVFQSLSSAKKSNVQKDYWHRTVEYRSMMEAQMMPTNRHLQNIPVMVPGMQRGTNKTHQLAKQLNYFFFPESSECFLLLLSLCLCIPRIRRHGIAHRVLYTEKQINQSHPTSINEFHRVDGLSAYQTLNDEHWGKPNHTHNMYRTGTSTGEDS